MCLSVLSRPNRLTNDFDFWYGNIVGQGGRSKVKVARSENVTSRLLPEGNSHVKSLWPMV